MAAGEPKFSYITVTPDDEDVVVQAGARPARAADPADEAPGTPAARPASDGAVAPEPAEGAAVEGARFQETTLDDLGPVPMPAAQKIVLALGSVGVIAAVAWYLFLR